MRATSSIVMCASRVITPCAGPTVLFGVADVGGENLDVHLQCGCQGAFAVSAYEAGTSAASIPYWVYPFERHNGRSSALRPNTSPALCGAGGAEATGRLASNPSHRPAPPIRGPRLRVPAALSPALWTADGVYGRRLCERSRSARASFSVSPAAPNGASVQWMWVLSSPVEEQVTLAFRGLLVVEQHQVALQTQAGGAGRRLATVVALGRGARTMESAPVDGACTSLVRLVAAHGQAGAIVPLHPFRVSTRRAHGRKPRESFQGRWGGARAAPGGTPASRSRSSDGVMGRSTPPWAVAGPRAAVICGKPSRRLLA